VSRVVDEVRRFMARHAADNRVTGVVAVSGGADSVALLRALLQAGYTNLTVAHYNHGLRGAESDADEAFVEALVTQLQDQWPGIAFVSETASPAELRHTIGQNLEATARDRRYRWLGAIAGAWIATGHTADDQAETVLHRLIRGTGVQGLRGIAAVRGKIIRPLLTVTRAEILQYLSSLGQLHRTDSSNADLRFTRNRIRHELLPLLRTFNPEIVAVLGRLATQAEEVFDHLQADAEGLRAAAELPRAGTLLVFDAATLAAAPPHRVRDMLRLVWQRQGWSADGMTFTHWERLAGIARGELPAADFPGGVHCRRVGRVVQIGRRS
jgi:tRNA(Ile)-lysidine synthase